MLNYMLFFLSGLMTKLSDDIVDENILKKRYGYLFSFFSGLIFSHLFSVSTAFSTLILAVLSSLLFAGKFDHKIHQICLGTFLLGLFVFGPNSLNFIVFPVLFLASFFDEYFNQRFENRFFKYRLGLELACLGISIILLDPSYFVAIFGFDVGYVLPHFLLRDHIP